MILYAYRNCGVAKYFSFSPKNIMSSYYTQDNAIQLIHYSDMHEPLYTCSKTFLDSCFASIWSTSFCVQLSAIVSHQSHHSNPWPFLVMCFILKNVLVKPFTELIAYISQIVKKKSKCECKKWIFNDIPQPSFRYAINISCTVSAQFSLFCYLENCVSLA